jgi:hypothetical protein
LKFHKPPLTPPKGEDKKERALNEFRFIVVKRIKYKKLNWFGVLKYEQNWFLFLPLWGSQRGLAVHGDN